MISTLRISHLIDSRNYGRFSGIEAHEYHDTGKLLDRDLPVLFHDGLGVVEEEFPRRLDEITEFLNERNVVMFSFDLGPAAENVSVEGYYYVPEGRVLSRGEVKDLVNRRLDYVRSKFEGMIALENLNFFPSKAYAHVCDPAFIREVLYENDVYLLLDIAHAVISAHNLGSTPAEYISSLPLEKVREIHICAPGIVDGDWRDLHNVPGYEEFNILEQVLGQIPHTPYVVVEYYRDLAGIVSAYRELHRLAQFI